MYMLLLNNHSFIEEKFKRTITNKWFWCAFALVLLIGLLAINSISPYLYSLAILLVSLIIGFLFPKSMSNINETISAFLVMLMLMILSMLANIKWTLVPIIILLIIILY
ncbi:MAG: hypothetical protein EOM50_04290 [Erysipelotrichia bacterium]|nr:hypothetical protein [Erysipelotrichia bacterium]